MDRHLLRRPFAKAPSLFDHRVGETERVRLASDLVDRNLSRPPTAAQAGYRISRGLLPSCIRRFRYWSPLPATVGRAVNIFYKAVIRVHRVWLVIALAIRWVLTDAARN